MKLLILILAMLCLSCSPGYDSTITKKGDSEGKIPKRGTNAKRIYLSKNRSKIIKEGLIGVSGSYDIVLINKHQYIIVYQSGIVHDEECYCKKELK